MRMRSPKFSSERISLSSPTVIGALLVIALLLGVSATRIVLRAWSIRRERAAMEGRIRELEAEKQRLEQALLGASSPETVERLAKERLNLKQPGEEVVVVTPPAKPSLPEASRFSRLIPSWLRELFAFLGR